MVMTATPDNSPAPYVVLRPLWFAGRACAAGDVLHLPRVVGAELQAAAKVRRALPGEAEAPAADPAAEPVVEQAIAPRRRRAAAGGDAA